MAGTAIEDRLMSEREILHEFKEKVSKIYQDLGSFIVKTSEHMADFRKMIMPHVHYFFPTGERSSSASFIVDVVAPSRRELDGAVDRAVGIMAKDLHMNEIVSKAVAAVLGLKKSIDVILQLIDEIDIYSENTLIISTKYGEEGMSLARISNEMVAMARLVNGIGEKFRNTLAKLDASSEEFGRIRQRMEIIGENYLTRMKVDLSLEFNTMTAELGSVSEHVSGMLASSDDIECSMKDFINNIQMEDVIRQKLEKIISYLDGFASAAGNEADSNADLDAVLLQLAFEQLGGLDKDVSWQYDEVHGFCDRISLLLDDILSRFYGESESDVDKEQNRMEGIYNRIEGFKNDYIRNMEEIISDKKKILDLCMGIKDILGVFEGLFSGIGDTVKKFEALNMITRIELARHARLSRTLGGTLRSVKSLPAQMKKIVQESQDLYHRTQKDLEEAVVRYAGNFKLQEEVLVGCIGSMKNVSVKLNESQAYYRDISREIGRYCWKVVEFIDGDGRMNGLFEAKKSIRDILARVAAHRDAEFAGRGCDLDELRRRMQDIAGKADPGSIIAALSGDFGAEKTREQVIIF